MSQLRNDRINVYSCHDSLKSFLSSSEGLGLAENEANIFAKQMCDMWVNRYKKMILCFTADKYQDLLIDITWMENFSLFVDCVIGSVKNCEKLFDRKFVSANFEENE